MDEIECTICLEILSCPVFCYHCYNYFCKSCIERWLDIKGAVCPLCRKKLLKTGIKVDPNIEKITEKVKTDFSEFAYYLEEYNSLKVQEKDSFKSVFSQLIAIKSNDFEEYLINKKKYLEIIQSTKQPLQQKIICTSIKNLPSGSIVQNELDYVEHTNSFYKNFSEFIEKKLRHIQLKRYHSDIMQEKLYYEEKCKYLSKTTMQRLKAGKCNTNWNESYVTPIMIVLIMSLVFASIFGTKFE